MDDTNTKHKQLLVDLKNNYQSEYEQINTTPKAFIEDLKRTIVTENINTEKLVEIHQQLYLYYYTNIANKYTELVEFFKKPNNNDFRQTLYKIRNNTDFEKDIDHLKTLLYEIQVKDLYYLKDNTLKKAIIEFLDNVKNESFYIKNIINIFKLYNNYPIDIKFIKPKINKDIDYESDAKFKANKLLDSINTTEKSFLKTISRIESDIRRGINITSITGQKGINNQKKQLLYFCQLFIELESLESNDYSVNSTTTSLKEKYDALITELNDHISNFLKKTKDPKYVISTTDDIEVLHKLRKYILNESLIDQLIKEYKTYFDSEENEEYREVAKNKSEEHNKDLTNLIPLSNYEKIKNLASTPIKNLASTSFENIKSKLPAYLNNIIIIIIFLIFLNLFITTYFYFTTSIQATANRSNCGGASLCEAETHRHLFLEDNGNDKARDIYIIIVVIFSIYLLSEIFKSYKDGIKFDDDENTISVVPILILFLYFAFIVGTISGIIDKAKSNNKNPEGINVVSSALFMFYLFVIGIILYYTKGVKNALDRNYPSKIIKFLTVTIPLIIIGVEIGILAEGSRYDLFKGFSGDDFNLINPKFKANTALHIIFLVFYIIFFVVVFRFDKNIKTLHIWGLVFLAFILFTLFTFILLSSLDFKNTEYTDWLMNIKHSTSSMQYFVLLAPLLISLDLFPVKLNISANAIKLIVLYYVILFIIYLFYVYFVNHSNEIGILSLESFQLYNWANEHKNEEEKGLNNESNYKKELNKANTGFVAVLLLILLVISALNEDPNLDNIIYGIIVFILASYITGVVYLLYNELFPIQQASFKYKKNLVDINNEISQHIKVEEEEHTIDKNKIRVFKIANEKKDIEDIHKRINSQRKDGTTDKEKHMKNIRDIFSEISPKGSSYEDYRSQSTDQMQYEEYIYRLFSVWTNTDFKFQTAFNETIFGADNFEQDALADTYRLNSYKLYNSIILKLPKTKAELIEYTKDNGDISPFIQKIAANTQANTFIQGVFKIPKANNIEYVIKKNYKYVTGEEGVIQKYNSDRKMNQDTKNALYWIKLQGSNKKGFHYDNTYYGAKDVEAGSNYYKSENYTEWYRVDDGPEDSNRRFFSAFKYIKGSSEKKPSPGDHNNDDEIRNMLSNSSEADIFKKIGLSPENLSEIKMKNNILYKMKISEFNKIKEQVKDEDRVYFMVFEDKQTKLINCYVSYNITNSSSITITSEASYINPIKNEIKPGSEPPITELQDYIDKTDPVLAPFYTIGYNYENHTRDHQQMNKDTAYSIPARYYACSYLNYFPNEDGSMSKVKFAKNIKEDNYNPLNTKNTIIDRIAERYDENAKETKIQLAPEKFQFLLVFLVILAIILLMFLFNIIKKYFTGDVYTPQMYVLGMLAVFLTIFIFGEVIFARIK